MQDTADKEHTQIAKPGEDTIVQPQIGTKMPRWENFWLGFYTMETLACENPHVNMFMKETEEEMIACVISEKEAKEIYEAE